MNLLRLIGFNCASLVFAQVVRLQLSNVAVRNCRTTGVQDAPKLLIVINYAERGNPVFSSRYIGTGITVRRADEAAGLRIRKKQRLRGNIGDSV